MTRFLEPFELRDTLVASGDAVALELADRLEGAKLTELIAAEPANTSSLLPTYETRLAAAEAGIGPRTEGLEHFVAALRIDRPVEIFSVSAADVVGIGLLAATGNLLAVTLVHAGG